VSLVSFTVENFRDLIKLLEEHPEWRAELRRLVLSEELLTVPERLDRLTRAVESSEARLTRVDGALQELAAAQARTEAALAELSARQAQTEAALTALAERVDRLAEGQAALSARMDRVEAALAELAERQAQTEAALARLTERVDQLTVSHSNLRREVDDLKGWTLELRYERRLPSILGHVLRRASVATPVAFLEQIEDRISEEGFEELRHADLLVRGRLKSDPQRTVWLVVEVSGAIDPNDVARASRRASLLRQAGELAIPVVAGARLTAEAEALLSVQPVVLIQDGSASGWERALAHWESPAAST